MTDTTTRVRLQLNCYVMPFLPHASLKSNSPLSHHDAASEQARTCLPSHDFSCSARSYLLLISALQQHPAWPSWSSLLLAPLCCHSHSTSGFEDGDSSSPGPDYLPTAALLSGTKVHLDRPSLLSTEYFILLIYLCLHPPSPI